jgi:hypothetical protein
VDYHLPLFLRHLFHYRLRSLSYRVMKPAEILSCISLILSLASMGLCYYSYCLRKQRERLERLNRLKQ